MVRKYELDAGGVATINLDGDGDTNVINNEDFFDLSVSATAAELSDAIAAEIERAVSNKDVADLSEARLLAVLGCGAPPTIATISQGAKTCWMA